MFNCDENTVKKLNLILTKNLYHLIHEIIYGYVLDRFCDRYTYTYTYTFNDQQECYLL